MHLILVARRYRDDAVRHLHPAAQQLDGLAIVARVPPLFRVSGFDFRVSGVGFRVKVECSRRRV